MNANIDNTTAGPDSNEDQTPQVPNADAAAPAAPESAPETTAQAPAIQPDVPQAGDGNNESESATTPATLASFEFTRSTIRTATSEVLGNAADAGGAVYFRDEPALAFRVERIAAGATVPSSESFNKSFFAQSPWPVLMNIFAGADSIAVCSRNVPEFVLRKIDPAMLGPKTEPLTRKPAPAPQVLRSIPEEVRTLLNDLCVGFKSKYNVDLELGSVRGRLVLPNAETADWSFVCIPGPVEFPVYFECEGTRLQALTLGHYKIRSSRPDGFDAVSLESAVTHCFNLIS